MRASHAVFLALFVCVAVEGGKCAIDGTTRPACCTSRTAARLRGVDTKLVCTSVSWCGEWCTCYSFAALSACHHEGDVIFEVDVPWVISLFPTVRHPYSRIVPQPPCSFSSTVGGKAGAGRCVTLVLFFPQPVCATASVMWSGWSHAFTRYFSTCYSTWVAKCVRVVHGVHPHEYAVASP
jgi:hypothetical protein